MPRMLGSNSVAIEPEQHSPREWGLFLNLLAAACDACPCTAPEGVIYLVNGA